LRVARRRDTFLGGAHQQVTHIVDAGGIAASLRHGVVMSRGMEHWHSNPDFFFQVGVARCSTSAVLRSQPHPVDRPGKARDGIFRFGTR